MPTTTNTSPRTRRRCLEAGAVVGVFAGASLLTLASAAARASATKPAMALHCTLKAPARIRLGEPVWLEWEFSNRGPQDAQFLVWGTPFDRNWFAPYVRVTRDGTPLNYGGAQLKRGDPAADQYLALAAGQARSARVELNAAFDLQGTGHYRVQPQITLHDVIRGAAAQAPRPRAQHASEALACKAVDFEIYR